MFHTAEQAKREAIARKSDNDGLNALGGQSEWAYSPTLFTVGMREAGHGQYRVINVNYPYYGQADQVTDWVSVGVEKPKRGWHWRFSGIWKQFKNVRGTKYRVIDGMLVQGESNA